VAALSGAVVLAAGSACGGKAVIDGAGGGGSSGNGSAGGAEPTACKMSHDSPQSAPVWGDVFAIMLDPAEQRCGAGACHGDGTAASGFYFSETDEPRSYVNLITFEDASGARYVDADAPRRSWIHCHLRPDSVSHRISAEAHLVIEDWLLSGATGP
jgi:hypothetical protein